MPGVPEDVERLLRERDAARAAKDFARADALRDRIDQMGWEVRDAPDGATAIPKPPFEVLDPSTVVASSEPPSKTVSIHVLHEGFPDDLTRFLEALGRWCGAHDYEVVVSEAGGADGEWLASLESDRVRTLHFPAGCGWARGRNASLKTGRGAVVAMADLSVEPTGDLLAPVLAAFDDPAVGAAGPWGLVSKDMRTFEEAPPGEVDAVEGYFLATRREILSTCLLDEKFTWYRHADIDFSFRVRSLGFRVLAVDAPGVRHAHRGWEAVPEEERARLSKRNYNRFLDHFRSRHDLLLSHREK